MNYMERYNEWLYNDYFDRETREELLSIKDDKKEIEDRFFKDLEFGTGGLRGVIGAGTNRINKYNIRRATQGLANYIFKECKKPRERGVVIAYDSRHKSPEFAKEAALVLAGNGIKAFLFEGLRSTPELSFAVRELNCVAGIVITASHNPPEYNGYKVYGEDGGQMVPKFANRVIKEIQAIKDFFQVKYLSEDIALEKGLLEIIGEEIDKKYIDRVKTLSIHRDLIKELDDFKIIYTPLHGSGAMPVKRVLKEIGFKNVIVVKEQEIPDSNFSTVKSPNPEERDAFEMAIDLAKREEADIIIGTDPDCDRVGAVVKDNNGAFKILTGNQIGALLIDYILSSMENIPKNSVMVKTIVTSELGRAIADYYGVDTIDTLTGFKFIGEKIKEFEEKGDKKFIFGYEESYGYLAGTFVRDKDGVIASLLIAEMAAYYKSKGMNLLERLEDLYARFGYYKEDLISITLKGKEGLERIGQIMDDFRNNPPQEFEGFGIKLIMDCLHSRVINKIKGEESPLELPKSDVLRFTLTDGSWFAVRPSGTEPKLKIYISTVDGLEEKSQEKLRIIKNYLLNRIK